MFWRRKLPCALPNIFAGLKVGISLALVGAVVGEFVAANDGLGFVVTQAEGDFNTVQMFAAIAMVFPS